MKSIQFTQSDLVSGVVKTVAGVEAFLQRLAELQVGLAQLC